MNVLQVSQNYFVTGGSDTYFFALSSLLRDMGHDVVPFASQDARNLPSEWSAHFPKTYRDSTSKVAGFLEYLYSSESRKAITGLLARRPLDIAHLHIYYGGLTASILEPLRRAGVPIVQTLHEYKLVCPVYTLENRGRPCDRCVKGTPLNGILHRCKNGSLVDSTIRVSESLVSRALGDVRLVDRFISVSDFHRRKMIEGGIPERKLVTVHNFVDTDAIQPSEEDHGYALYFGRVEKLKGIGTLLEAFSGMPMRLVIAGHGGALEHFTALAKERGLHNVEFVGFRGGEELRRLIRRARFCVVPSEWYENCPMSVLEAMAHGKPVVGADIGGIPELIRDGVDGFLFPAGSAEQLRNSCSMLADGKLAASLGRQARDRVEQAFSRQVHYAKIMDIYRDVSRKARAAG